MGFAIVKHEEKRYLALRAFSTWEDSDTADVCLLELTREAVERWKSLFATFDEIKAKHDVSYIAFVDYSPKWMPGDHELDPIDDGEGDEVLQPNWEADEARTDLDRVEVLDDDLEFCTFGKHTDERLNAILWRRDLPAIEAALNDA